MEESSLSVRIDRKSSIETEPRTLSIDQVQYAREAALHVMNTRSIEEAMNVFMEGLKPMETGRRDNNRRVNSEEEVQFQYLEDQLRLPVLRDIASAPF